MHYIRFTSFLAILFVLLIFSCVSTKRIVRQDFFNAKYECTWSVNFLEDTINMTRGTEDWFILKIDNNYTHGYNYLQFRLDSFGNLPKDEFHLWLDSKIEDFKNGINFVKEFNASTLCKARVYKNYEENKLHVIDNINNNFFIIEENLIPQDWVIYDETMTIEGYKCQKAECNWRGRDWIAWFTQEIQINEGPWKFYGLPGLIIKLHDTKHHYDFCLAGIKNIEEKIDIRPLYTKKINDTSVRKLTNIDRKKFLRIKFGKKGDLIREAEMAKLGFQSERVDKKYGYIELDY